MPDRDDGRRNVVLLVMDSLRKDRISPYNDDVDFTPNLNGLAEKSTVYADALSQAPWTLPSHASIFTGQYPWEHGATHKKNRLDTDRKLLAEKFQDEGYETCAITPNTWISDPMGTTAGFDRVENFLGAMSYGPLQSIFSKFNNLFNSMPSEIREKVAYWTTRIFEDHIASDICKSDQTVNEARKYLTNVDKKEDFFLFINLMSPHEPYEIGEPPEKYLDRHGVEDLSKVPGTEREFFHGEYDKEEMRKAYDASVEYTDSLVGRIYDKLRDEGLLENTIFVLASDHGQAVGENEIYGHQFTLMDSVVNVPLMILEPEGDHKEIEGPFELRNLYETIPYYSGLTEEPVTNSESSKGGYEFPEVFVGVIPEEKREKYDRKLRYVAEDEKKIVKAISRDGSTEYKMMDRETGEKLDIDPQLKEKVDRISKNTSEDDEESRSVDEEEIKQRLEDLGYR